MERLDHQLNYLHAAQASAWIEKLRDPSPVTSNEFVAWLKQSPQNVREFLVAISLDEALDGFDEQRRFDINLLLQRAGNRIVPFGRVQSSRGPRSSSYWRTGSRRAVAAFCALAILAVGIVSVAPGFGWKSAATARGEQHMLQLEDGTQIALNTDTRIRYRLSANVREIKLLSGEALFTVHHDAARPFRVYTRQATIQAVGTQFNVYSHDDNTVVSVLEGRITAEASSASQPPISGSGAPASRTSVQTVSAAEEARIGRTGEISVRLANNISDATAWREKRLTFRAATLENIAAEVNRYNRQQILIVGDEIRGRTYSGIFVADDPTFLAKVLAAEGGLAIDISPQTIVIRSRSDAAQPPDRSR